LGWTPSRSQIKACMRAMHSITRKFPQYAIIPRRGPKNIVLYEIADPVSVLRAKCAHGDLVERFQNSNHMGLPERLLYLAKVEVSN
jgi:hypothetical protein